MCGLLQGSAAGQQLRLRTFYHFSTTAETPNLQTSGAAVRFWSYIQTLNHEKSSFTDGNNQSSSPRLILNFSTRTEAAIKHEKHSSFDFKVRFLILSMVEVRLYLWDYLQENETTFLHFYLQSLDPKIIKLQHLRPGPYFPMCARVCAWLMGKTILEVGPVLM